MRIWTALLLAALTACQAADATPQANEFSGERALARVSDQVGFGPRVPGTAGHQKTARWLDSIGRALADTTIRQEWIHRTASGDTLPMINIMARFNPTATDRILYMAHWDTRPRADAYGDQRYNPIQGANDGASGVAVLIGVMEALKKNPPKGGVDILFLDGEDYGQFVPELVDVLIGSTYYVANPIVAEKPRFAVLFDLVGQYDLRLPIEQESQIAAPDVVDLVWSTAERLGHGNIFVRRSGGTVIDDHIPFIRAGYKAIDIIPDISAYPHWHTTNDTYDKVSARSLGAVGAVAVAVIRTAFK